MPTTPPRRLFVAGSTGSTGRTVLDHAATLHVPLVAHQRPRPNAPPSDPRVAVCDLSDAPALAAAMTGCTTVLQLIGTMRKRFARGDTYETSDIGTTRSLVAAARTTGVDHIVLLSSTGAGKPMGAYLKAKAEAERIVRESGIAYTIFRPSAFDGAGHRPPPGWSTITRVLGLRALQPIAIDDLAGALIESALVRGPLNSVLEGESLWSLVEQARVRPR